MSPWEENIARLLRGIRLHSIKQKILVFALVATLIPSLATTWVSYVQNKRSLTQKVTEQLHNSSGQAAREIDLWLKERFIDVRVFSSSYVVSESLERLRVAPLESVDGREALSSLSDYLNSVREPFADYEKLVVLDPAGGVITTSGTAGAEDLPPEWADMMLMEHSAQSGVYWDQALETRVMWIAVPIKAADDRGLGTLTAKLNFQAIDEVLARFTRGEASEVLVITQRGNPILSSRSPSSELRETRLPARTVEALFDTTATTVNYTDPRGEHVVGAATLVPTLDWVVAAQIPSDVAFAQVARLRNVATGLLLALLLGVGLLAYTLGLIIVRPLARLTQGASRVAAGDLDVDVPVVGGGEVRYLTEVFNDMVARLKQGREDLAASNATLALQNEKLERLSITDGLTMLYNRRHIMEILTQEARRSRRQGYPLSVLMIDVDSFKLFNDTHGHLAGDEALKQVSSMLLESTRDVDFVARYGGEEFLVMLRDTEIDGAVHVAERIRSCVEEKPINVGGTEAHVTVSIGAAALPKKSDDPEVVIGNADAAMYQAKRSGRNRVVRDGDVKPQLRKEA
ncbi:MAG: diguanylate cyclase [Gemmatimonadales bacterium]|nr:diguanylate cyclase [Gemmatimonadales bacterium]